ncbi:MAG: hypothetical protein JXR58_13870 [Bacteroidales bacterium]|nr:hypothetical protein [Bacteroidales bacterium]
MPEKFRNKYRIASHRKPGWDYSSNGAYFITLITQNRICNLGEIIVDTYGADTQGVDTQGVDTRGVDTHGRAYIQLSDFGKIVDTEWQKSFEIRTELFLDTYIMMPNHLHAIVVIKKNEKMTAIENGFDAVVGDGGVADHVETHGRASLPSISISPSQTFFRLPKSISSFLAGFKSAVNSKIDDYIDQQNLNIPKYNRNNHFFQSNYYDHIIRNEQSYKRISEYISNNPAKWTDDKFYIN